MKKILLLSTVPPSNNYSGGQVLAHLCRFLAKGSLVCFCLLDKHLKPQIPDDLSWIPVKYASKPADGWPKLPFITPILSFVGEIYHAVFTANRLRTQIVDYGKKNKVTSVWVTLQGQTTIRLAKKIAQDLEVPLLVEVWDDPDWWLKDNHVDRISAWFIRRNFAAALSFARSCATAGPAMAESYSRNYQAKTIAFLPSLDKAWAIKIRPKIHSPEELTIGVVGQLYSSEEWSALIRALDLNSWKIGQREIKIRLLGSYANLYTDLPARIEYLGYHSQKEAVKLMSQCDILYCPYIFNPSLRKVSELSFPGKLVTYLAAGRPVLFHGPPYSGPGIFLKKHRAGFVCESLDPEAIERSLTKLVKDTKLFTELAQRSQEVFFEFFTFGKLKESFREFINVKK